MPFVRRLSLALALSLSAGSAAVSTAHAGEPLTVSPAEEEALYKQARGTAVPPKTADPAATEKFAREGCFADPSKCKCQSTDAAKSQFCGTVLGHFCPDSTLRYLAAACMDLFGGATLCQCAAKQQIEAYISAEDAAKAKADKAAAKKAKKKAPPPKK